MNIAKAFGWGLAGVVAIPLLLTVLSENWVFIQKDPILLTAKNILLAALNEPTQGITVEGDISPPTVKCDTKTGVCRVQE